MDFKVYGPFRMPRTDSGLIAADAAQKKVFWSSVEDADEGLSEACGCYIFTILPSGGGAKPWYVGMTCRLGFRGECFQSRKINLYNSAIAGYDRATPQLFLVAKSTRSKATFAKASSNGHADIKELEEILIGVAYSRNQRLLNMRGTKFLKRLVVPGVMNSPPGNPGVAASKLKEVLGL